MKQGIKFLLCVRVGIDLQEIEKMEFIFEQGDKKALFLYPSDNTKQIDYNSIGLIWEPEQTYIFEPGEFMEMDTRITLKESEYQPETEVLKLIMNRTLFEEVTEND